VRQVASQSNCRTQIRVLTVDDHPILREGIAAVIALQSDMVIVGEATNGSEAIKMYRTLRPDITLMDLRLPEINGIDATRAICQDYPHAKIIALTVHKGDVQVGRAFKAGASSYLLKSMLRKDLLHTIRLVYAGNRYIPPEVAADLAVHAFDEMLTNREIEILREVAGGAANKIVAARLHISEDTVKKHMKNILSKLSATDRTHATMIAVKRGFLEV